MISFTAHTKNCDPTRLRPNVVKLSLLVCLFVWLVGFLTSSLTTRLYRGQVPRLTSDNFTCCHTRDRVGRPLTFVSAGHIILTPTQPVGSGRPQRESNPAPPHQESRALPIELPSAPPPSLLTVEYLLYTRVASEMRVNSLSKGLKHWPGIVSTRTRDILTSQAKC